MVKLPDRQVLGRRRDALPGGIIPSYSPRGFSAGKEAMAAAFGQAANAAFNAADIFQRDQDKLEEFETARKFYETEGAVDQQYQHNVETADPTGRDFAKTDTETTKPHWDSFLAGVPPRLRPKYDMLVTRERMSRERRALGYEFKRREEHYIGEVGKRAEQLIPQVSADPDQYDASLSDINTYLDSSGLTPTSKQKLRETIEDQLGQARIQGLIGAGRVEEAEQFKNQLNERDRQKLEQRSGAGGGTYASAIASIESGGRYDKLGPVTKNGDRAYGKYQVMGANVGPWTERHYGQRLTPQEFLDNKAAQDAVFEGQFGSYVSKYGPSGAARAWFAGEGGMNDRGRRDVLGTSVDDYERKFNRIAGTRLAQADTGTATDASAQRAGPDPSGAPDELLAGDTAAPAGRWDAVFQKALFNRDKAIAEQNKELARQEAEAEKAEAARVDRTLIDASAGLGPMPPRSEIENNPLLKPEKQNELLRKYDAANKENIALQNDMRRYTFGDPFNAYSTEDKKSLDRIYKAKGGNLEALDEVVSRTGIAPPLAVEQMRGALASSDPKRVGDTAAVAVGMMDRNPNVFAGRDGGSQIEDAALAYRRYVTRWGMTAEEAAAKIAADNTPEAQAKIKARVKNEDVDAIVKKKLKLSDLGSRFDTSWLPWSDPKVEFTPKQRRAAFDDYADLFRDKYMQHGDEDLAKDQAAAQMKKLWGVTEVNGSQAVVRFAPERAPAYANIKDVSSRFAEQAIAEIKAGTGQDVTRDRLVISPVPSGHTARAYFAGQPPPYVLQWLDKNGNLQTLQPGKAFVADPDVMRAPERMEQERRRAQEEMQRRVREPSPAQQQQTRERRAQEEDIAAEKMSTLGGLAERRQNRLEEMEVNRQRLMPDEAAPAAPMTGGSVTLPGVP